MMYTKKNVFRKFEFQTLKLEMSSARSRDWSRLQIRRLACRRATSRRVCCSSGIDLRKTEIPLIESFTIGFIT